MVKVTHSKDGKCRNTIQYISAINWFPVGSLHTQQNIKMLIETDFVPASLTKGPMLIASLRCEPLLQGPLNML